MHRRLASTQAPSHMRMVRCCGQSSSPCPLWCYASPSSTQAIGQAPRDRVAPWYGLPVGPNATFSNGNHAGEVGKNVGTQSFKGQLHLHADSCLHRSRYFPLMGLLGIACDVRILACLTVLLTDIPQERGDPVSKWSGGKATPEYSQALHCVGIPTSHSICFECMRVHAQGGLGGG